MAGIGYGNPLSVQTSNSAATKGLIGAQPVTQGSSYLDPAQQAAAAAARANNVSNPQNLSAGAQANIALNAQQNAANAAAMKTNPAFFPQPKTQTQPYLSKPGETTSSAIASANANKPGSIQSGPSVFTPFPSTPSASTTGLIGSGGSGGSGGGADPVTAPSTETTASPLTVGQGSTVSQQPMDASQKTVASGPNIGLRPMLSTRNPSPEGMALAGLRKIY